MLPTCVLESSVFFQNVRHCNKICDHFGALFDLQSWIQCWASTIVFSCKCLLPQCLALQQNLSTCSSWTLMLSERLHPWTQTSFDVYARCCCCCCWRTVVVDVWKLIGGCTWVQKRVLCCPHVSFERWCVFCVHVCAVCDHSFDPSTCMFRHVFFVLCQIMEFTCLFQFSGSAKSSVAMADINGGILVFEGLWRLAMQLTNWEITPSWLQGKSPCSKTESVGMRFLMTQHSNVKLCWLWDGALIFCSITVMLFTDYLWTERGSFSRCFPQTHLLEKKTHHY